MIRTRLYHRQFILGLLTALVFMGALAPLAHAADSESITLSPTNKRYKADAGTNLTDELTVLNDGDQAYDFTVYTSPYSVDSATYDPDYGSKKANADAYSWVSFTKSTYHAEPRQTVKVPFTIHVRENAAPGGHYGVIFAEVQPNDSNSTIVRKKRVGMILQLTVNGDVKYAGSVEKISTDWFQNKAPLTTKVSVKNTGNTDYDASVKYDVSDIFGNLRYSQTQQFAIFPDSTRPISLDWKNAPWLGFYKVKTTATALDDTKTKESYVLMAPTWFVYTIIAVCGAGVIYAIRKPSKKN